MLDDGEDATGRLFHLMHSEILDACARSSCVRLRRNGHGQLQRAWLCIHGTYDLPRPSIVVSPNLEAENQHEGKQDASTPQSETSVSRRGCVKEARQAPGRRCTRMPAAKAEVNCSTAAAHRAWQLLCG